MNGDRFPSLVILAIPVAVGVIALLLGMALSPAPKVFDSILEAALYANEAEAPQGIVLWAPYFLGLFAVLTAWSRRVNRRGPSFVDSDRRPMLYRLAFVMFFVLSGLGAVLLSQLGLVGVSIDETANGSFAVTSDPVFAAVGAGGGVAAIVASLVLADALVRRPRDICGR